MSIYYSVSMPFICVTRPPLVRARKPADCKLGLFSRNIRFDAWPNRLSRIAASRWLIGDYLANLCRFYIVGDKWGSRVHIIRQFKVSLVPWGDFCTFISHIEIEKYMQWILICLQSLFFHLTDRTWNRLSKIEF